MFSNIIATLLVIMLTLLIKALLILISWLKKVDENEQIDQKNQPLGRRTKP